ncbi:MAG TPA: DUF1345 domain-containing protein [Pedococcus sp.]|nr:DUF1345 domain-containing protein [Pedococcus sp.]
MPNTNAPQGSSNQPQSHTSRRSDPPARVRVAVAGAAGVATGVGASFPLTWQVGLLLGWMTTAAIFVGWTWLTVWPMGQVETASRAVREDPGRAASDLVVLVAAIGSLGAVGLLLLGGTSSGGTKDVQAAMSLVGVGLAWGAVHTMFTTRYARLYYTSDTKAVDFNEDDPPCYRDFGYLAFTIGMTFQVSDTPLQTKEIRATALRHALLSYLFGVVVIATTINLVAGLGK